MRFFKVKLGQVMGPVSVRLWAQYRLLKAERTKIPPLKLTLRDIVVLEKTPSSLRNKGFDLCPPFRGLPLGA